MHVRGRILEAVKSAVSSVPAIADVTIGSPWTPNGSAGTVADIWIHGEESSKATGTGRPNTGELIRKLSVSVTIAADLTTAGFSLLQVEDEILAPIEVAMANNQQLVGLADDWFIAGSHYEYPQDGSAASVLATLLFKITYLTPTADPGLAL